MGSLIDEILFDIDWRVAELATLKTIPIKYNFNDAHRELHLKYAVPAIYSLWEGFIKTCLPVYLRHINALNIKRSEISLNLLTHHIDSTCKLHNPRSNFDSKKRVVGDLDSLFVDAIAISVEIPTESNVNYKVLCGLLNRFCIEVLDRKFEKGLDRLLLFRNKIAHGENAIKVQTKDVHDFIDLVEDLMIDVIINIENSVKRQTFRRVVTGE